MREILICILLLLGEVTTGWGQILPKETGKPLMQNYSAKEYGGHRQIWSIVQDKRGMMYFGHEEGLVEYDGVSWRSIDLPKGKRVRSLVVDKQGVVYVALVDDFGYLDADEKGNLVYVSLLKAIPKTQHNFGDVWRVLAVGDKVCFISFTATFHCKNKKIVKTEYKAQAAYYHMGFEVYENWYEPHWTQGIVKKHKQGTTPVAGLENTGKQGVKAMLPYPGKKMMIIDRKQRFWVYSPRLKQIEPLNPSLDKVLKSYDIYCSVALPNKKFALGTRTKGVIIINAKGQIIHLLNKSNGLPDSAVFSLYYQPNTYNLWAGTDNGISKITIASPLQQYDADIGLEGTVINMCSFKGKLHVTTGMGVFRLDKKGFTRIKGIEGQSWQFLDYKIPDTNQSLLLVGNSLGMYVIKDRVASWVFGNTTIVKLHTDKTNPRRLFAGFLDGLGSIMYKKGRWVTEASHFKGLTNPPLRIKQETTGKLWVETKYRGIGYLKNNEIVVLDSSIQLPQKYADMIFYRNKLYYTSLKGVHLFDSVAYCFKPDKTFDKLFSNGKSKDKITFVGSDTSSKYWYISRNGLKTSNPCFKKKGKYISDTLTLKAIRHKVIYEPFIEPNGIYWIPSDEGLFRYDTKEPTGVQTSFVTMIRQVWANKDSLLYAGYKAIDKPVLNFADNSLTFDYAALYYNFVKQNQYRYQLQGYEKGWSEWTTKTQKEYTNLYEGVYTFRVKAKNIYGIESTIATYSFEILPPWHRTWWAYGLYALGFGLVLWASIKIYTMRLRTQKSVLEGKVVMRTREVVAQKEEITAQHDAIREKNKELSTQHLHIKQSIRSAQTIQAAILPFAEQMQKLLPDHFLIFRPKAIVSGDFYFLEKVDNKVIVATIDCTGHGVPGAFMSMISYALLNDIIKAKRMTNPGEILEELRTEIKDALKQEQTGQRNGMDVAMVAITNTTSPNITLEFAGAKRPLWYIAAGSSEVQQINGSKVSIGVEYRESRQVTTQILQLSKGSLVYLGTDGFADQNDIARVKFGGQRLKSLLSKNCYLPLAKQQKVYEQTLNEFMTGTEQRDDILLMGIRI